MCLFFQEYIFTLINNKLFQKASSVHLLPEAWDAGIRPLAVCLYMTLGCTLKKFLDLPRILTIM